MEIQTTAVVGMCVRDKQHTRACTHTCMRCVCVDNERARLPKALEEQSVGEKPGFYKFAHLVSKRFRDEYKKNFKTDPMVLARERYLKKALEEEYERVPVDVIKKWNITEDSLQEVTCMSSRPTYHLTTPHTHPPIDFDVCCIRRIRTPGTGG